MDRKCVCTGRVIAGRPVIERADTSYFNLALDMIRDVARGRAGSDAAILAEDRLMDGLRDAADMAAEQREARGEE